GTRKGRVEVVGQVGDRQGAPALGDPAQEPAPTDLGDVRHQSGEFIDIARRPVPAVLQAQAVAGAVDGPELAPGPAQGVADTADYLGRGFRPGGAGRQRAGDGELRRAQALALPAQRDVGDEGNVAQPPARLGARGDDQLDGE